MKISLVDLDNTLIDTEKAKHDLFRLWSFKFGISLNDIDAIYETFRKENGSIHFDLFCQRIKTNFKIKPYIKLPVLSFQPYVFDKAPSLIVNLMTLAPVIINSEGDQELQTRKLGGGLGSFWPL